jgi:dehydrogenase/reductase SDR family protein 4
VRVNCIAPGVVASGRLKKVLAFGKKDQIPEGAMSQIPLGRVGTVEEIASLIVALCTDDTGYMTGTVIDANGASYAA